MLHANSTLKVFSGSFLCSAPSVMTHRLKNVACLWHVPIKNYAQLLSNFRFTDFNGCRMQWKVLDQF